MTENVAVCDTLIIGAGTAGLEAYKAATENGAKCIIVEEGPMGTGTRRTGDTPASALMAAAKYAHAYAGVERYGMHAHKDHELDMDNVLNHVRSIRAKETSEILSFIYGMPEEKRFVGKARFIDQHAVQINDITQIEFETAVIATGSTTAIPYELSQYRVHGGIYTTSELFELEHLPQSIAVLGSSRSGLQLGQALSYFGAKVVVFGSRKLWKLTDDTVLDMAITLFKNRFDLELNCTTTAIERNESGFGLYYLDESQYENFVSVDSILAARARFPKTEGLNLREFGITMNRMGGIEVDDKLRTSVPHIFAAGEVTNPHLTVDEVKICGRFAGQNASSSIAASLPSRVRLDVLYTDPELAVVGMSHEEVKGKTRKDKNYISSEVLASDAGRFRLTNEDDGILRIYCDESNHAIVGAEMCLAHASHIAHFLAVLIEQEIPVEKVCEMSFFSPSYEEIVQQACLNAKRIFERKQS